jgi:hypothetical protein
MSRLLTPKFLLRGFEFSVLASLVGFGITLLYGNNLPAFLRGLGHIHIGWVAAGIVLASLDWIGGGLRLWICAPPRAPSALAQGLDTGRRHGRVGGVHHAAQLGRRPDDDVHPPALRHPAPGRDRRDVHELRVDGALLRHRRGRWP